MKIGIERNNYSVVVYRSLKDFLVQCFSHSDLAGMHRIKAASAQKSSSSVRHTLVEEQSHAHLGASQLKDFVVQIGSSISQCLPDIVFAKLRIFAPQLFPVSVGSDRVDNASHGETKIANARLAVHPFGITSDSREGHAQKILGLPARGNASSQPLRRGVDALQTEFLN